MPLSQDRVIFMSDTCGFNPEWLQKPVKAKAKAPQVLLALGNDPSSPPPHPEAAAPAQHAPPGSEPIVSPVRTSLSPPALMVEMQLAPTPLQTTGKHK